MFSRTRKDLRVDAHYREDLWHAEVDRRQIEQIMFNLFVNASQAMPDGGEIRIETDNEALDEAGARLHQVRPGRYVCIVVADTGIGMDEATLKRIFDPFFTTKEGGRGTGLGLASVYGIVKNHEGFMDVSSRPGQGASLSGVSPGYGPSRSGGNGPRQGFGYGGSERSSSWTMRMWSSAWAQR